MPTDLSICILGFYSDPSFTISGLHLPIRLSQVINKGKPSEKIILAIDPMAPTEEPVLFAPYQFKSLKEAISYLKSIENTKNKNIGYYNINNGTFRSRLRHILPRIKEFCIQNYFDAAIWSDIPPNFRFTTTTIHPSIQIQRYLRARPRVLKLTQEYIKQLPQPLINNPLLLRISQDNFIPRHLKLQEA